ncbi:MAG: arsenate reductase ArsC [Alphaproteobacteria bacterium]|nr:arsenate reductase ArsC [Alphaproteobacteria bacterium]
MRGPNGEDLPGAVLFCCNQNAIRSPMAAALFKQLYGKFAYVDSAGLRPGESDPFAVEAMREVGLDIASHHAKTFEELHDGSFDLIVTLTPESHHRALEMARDQAIAVEYWPILDPTAVMGNREQRIAAYRAVRDELARRIRERFATRPAPQA